MVARNDGLRVIPDGETPSGVFLCPDDLPGPAIRATTYESGPGFVFKAILAFFTKSNQIDLACEGYRHFILRLSDSSDCQISFPETKFYLPEIKDLAPWGSFFGGLPCLN
jgi:hypothetical protein